jgi:hypothetical protein
VPVSSDEEEEDIWSAMRRDGTERARREEDAHDMAEEA